MIVTRIEKMRSRQPRYRIHSDDGAPIILTEDLLVRFSLARGDELSEERLHEMHAASEQVSAKQHAYRFISYRARSEHEIATYLRRKGFSAERATATVEEFRHLGLVDDAHFAGMIVRDAITRGRSGPAAVRRKLLEKGISRQIIDDLVAEHFSDEVLKSTAIGLLIKRVERTRARLDKLDPPKRRARLYQYLCQRGFSSQTATHALNSIEV